MTRLRPSESRDLGLCSVNGPRRVPKPAARTTTPNAAEFVGCTGRQYAPNSRTTASLGWIFQPVATGSVKSRTAARTSPITDSYACAILRRGARRAPLVGRFDRHRRAASVRHRALAVCLSPSSRGASAGGLAAKQQRCRSRNNAVAVGPIGPAQRSGIWRSQGSHGRAQLAT